MTDQLFNPADLEPQPCPVPYCGSIRLPGQHQVITCAHDLDTTGQPGRRPRACLNDPSKTPIPY